MVRVNGLEGGMSIFSARIPVRDLLEAFGSGSRGEGVSSLNFSLKRILCRDEATVSGGVSLTEPAALQSSSSSLGYALSCNGRLCWGTDVAQRGSQRLTELQERDRTCYDAEGPQDTGHNTQTVAAPNTPTISVSRVKSLSASQTFQARVIVHRIDDIVQFGEFFPDIYVKVRMKKPPSEWYRTDVHRKCVDSKALFEYRIVLPPFVYPARPIRLGICRRVMRFPPMLQIVMMDEDQVTRDDKLGGVTLNLEDLVLPDDKEGCGVATLSNERVSLFDASSVRDVRADDAVFPRELTGYWPLLKKKKINRELKTVGSICLTLQLLTSKEASRYPAAPGNRSWPANRYPRLKRPRREHGRIRDKVVLGVIQNIEQVIAHATGIPNLKIFVFLVVVIVVVVLHVRPSHFRALAAAVYLNGREVFQQHPNKTKFLIFFYAVSCVAWIFMRKGIGSTKKQELGSSVTAKA